MAYVPMNRVRALVIVHEPRAYRRHACRKPRLICCSHQVQRMRNRASQMTRSRGCGASGTNRNRRRASKNERGGSVAALTQRGSRIVPRSKKRHLGQCCTAKEKTNSPRLKIFLVYRLEQALPSVPIAQ